MSRATVYWWLDRIPLLGTIGMWLWASKTAACFLLAWLAVSKLYQIAERSIVANITHRERPR